MKKHLPESELKSMYELKKASSEKRLIPFLLSFEQFAALYRNRINFKCFYTDKEMNFTKPSSPDYCSLERLDSTKGYEAGNLVWCRSYVNQLKADYVECGKSMKGIGDVRIHTIQRIKKVLENPVMLATRRQPYTDLFNAVEVKESEKHSERIKGLEEQRIKLDKEAAEKAEQEALKAKYKSQQELASYYNKKFKEFEGMRVMMQISIKEMRDLLRISRCKISKVPFDSIWDKHIWVINKALPVTKDNVVIVHKNVAESLDYLSKGDNMVLKTSMLNVLKVI